MGKIIGIDLGTSNSAAAAMEGGKPTIIASAEGTTVVEKPFHPMWRLPKTANSWSGNPHAGKP